MIDKQKIIDRIARTFYVTLFAAGILASVAIMGAGVFGVIFDKSLLARLGWSLLIVFGVGFGYSSIYYLKFVWKNNDFPTPDCE